MRGFMPQEVFNMCAVTAAQLSAFAKVPIETSAAELARAYEESYRDSDLAQDIAAAAEKVTSFMREFFQPQLIVGALTQMQFCIKHYKTDGRRKRLKILGGAFFQKERNALPDKVARCLADVAIFHVGTLNGKFPSAPEGWSM